jgi:hypothetical protein
VLKEVDGTESGNKNLPGGDVDGTRIGRCTVPDLHAFQPTAAFDDETTHAMGVAYDEARKVLGLSDKMDGATRLVADRIVDAASAGERDPIRLRDAAVSYFQNRTRGAVNRS